MRVGGEDSHLKTRLPDCGNGETKKASLVILRQGKCLTWSNNSQQGTFQVRGLFTHISLRFRASFMLV